MEEAFSDYQVFINHRGPDTKNTLASLLYESLCRFGIRVFLDREELPTGNRVSSEIEAAIVTSSVQIAIFSPRYAESAWCLEELCLMLQQCCHRGIIIPVFWGVEPSDLRRVNEGAYAEAFTKHKDRGRVEVDRWKETLKKAADIKGHEFHMREGDLEKFVLKIVDIVQEKVRREPLPEAEHLVGLHKAVENFSNEILKQIDPSADTTIVGIVGLGGSGKTTLATHLYNLKHSGFRRSSFLYDSRSRSGLTSLQEKLLSDLRGCSQGIWSPLEGMRLLRQNLRGLSRVLIVLDGIDSEEQIDSLLLPVKDVLVDGSLIVITCRDKGLLARHQIRFLYNIKLLDEKDAQELFCHHAFQESKVPTVSEDLVREMVKMCGGYPLALKDIGAQLLGKRMGQWKSQLTYLQENQFPNEIVEKIVKASYHSLEDKMKEVFLDVASFFEGLDSQLVVRVLGEEECQLLSWIETLDEKCLLEFHCVENLINQDLRPHKRRRLITSSPYRDYKIGMHKLVVNMAKKIVSEERSLSLSSDYQLQWWQEYLGSFSMVKGPPPHIIIDNHHGQNYGFEGFRQLKYYMGGIVQGRRDVYREEDYHSELLGLRSTHGPKLYLTSTTQFSLPSGGPLFPSSTTLFASFPTILADMLSAAFTLFHFKF